MRIAVIVLVAVAALMGACSGGKSATKTDQPSAAGPAPTPVEIKVPGTEPVVLVLNAALAGDAIELARLTGYSQIGCADGAAPTQGPTCREGEDAGKQVDAIGASQCAGSWLRPEAVPDAYRTALPGSSTLYAMYVPKADATAFGSSLGTQFVLVMQSGARADGSPNGAALHIKDGRIVLLQTPCDSFLQLVNPESVNSFVIAPKAAGNAPPAP